MLFIDVFFFPYSLKNELKRAFNNKHSYFNW